MTITGIVGKSGPTAQRTVPETGLVIAFTPLCAQVKWDVKLEEVYKRNTVLMIHVSWSCAFSCLMTTDHNYVLHSPK